MCVDLGNESEDQSKEIQTHTSQTLTDEEKRKLRAQRFGTVEEKAQGEESKLGSA